MVISIAFLVTLLLMHLNNRQIRNKQKRADRLMKGLREIEEGVSRIETFTEVAFWYHELLMLKGLHGNNREARQHFDRIYSRIVEKKEALLFSQCN